MTRKFTLTRSDITDLVQGFGLGALSVTTYVLAYLGIRSHFGLDWMPLYSTPYVIFAITVVAGAISLSDWAGERTRRRNTEDATPVVTEDTDN